MEITIKGSGFSPRGLKNIEACLRRIVDDGQVAGVGALVIRHGLAAYQQSFGMRDVAGRSPLQNDSIYRIFSMSKTFTVVAAMTLYEKGLFRLAEPIGEYLPAFAKMEVAESDERGLVRLVPAKNPITFEHLFTMTSGIPYPGPDSYGGRMFTDVHDTIAADALRGTFWNTAQMADAAAGIPLCFHPGEYWLYGFSHDILGRLIEVISGKSLGTYMKETIFDPLGLEDTSFYLPREKASRLVKPYEHVNGELIEIGELSHEPGSEPEAGERRFNPPNYILEYGRQMYRYPTPFESGGAGLVSTLDDLGKYAQMLLHSGKSGDVRILSRKTIDLIRKNHVRIGQMRNFAFPQIIGYGYGLGVRIMEDTAAAGLNGSAGEWAWDGALGTWYCVDPREDMTAVFLIQRIPGGYEDLCRRFAQTVYGAIDD
ncbi:MAG: beta-lactamase family protein [Spirochaetaceae bacterium]|jgi:CubicO group peptidase (beta-lactamase class C family)|nr:beta-lactamase family protein [Spirochaetaceae bacterium]